jgi:molybdenum cofactor cytidylyltransferase
MLAGVVLAAGRSSRFGSDKRIAACDQSDTLLTKSIFLIEPCCSRVFVVTKPSDAGREPSLLGYWWNHPKIVPVCASDAARGMGHSIANAVTELLKAEEANQARFSGLLLMLADMPYVKPESVQLLMAAHSLDNIVLPCYEYQNERHCGHPVIFGRRWFSSLQQLQGDRGGKSVLRNNPSAVLEIPVDDPGILLDVDRPDQLDAQ